MGCDWEGQQAYAYWLEGVHGLGRKSRWELVKAAGSPQAVYGMSGEEWRLLLPEKKAVALERARDESGVGDVEGRYREFCRGEVRYVSCVHPDYPERLRGIPDPPFGLFVWGNLPPERGAAVAVIGARECSEYGRYVAERVAEELAANGVSVISGMARGIDGISQRAVLRAGGCTYAVLGSGVDVCYPLENGSLYEALKTGGGILSEYLPGTQPQARLFPLRNRIISGLSDVVIIVEARERSGTLITADMALEQGKEVYAVPGRLTDPLSRGCNRLIRQGAGILSSVGEMLEETGILCRFTGVDGQGERSGKEKQGSQGSRGGLGKSGSQGIQGVLGKNGRKGETEGVFRYLDFYPKSVEQILKESGMEYRQVVCELMELCMENKAEQVSAGQYVRK